VSIKGLPIKENSKLKPAVGALQEQQRIKNQDKMQVLGGLYYNPKQMELISSYNLKFDRSGIPVDAQRSLES